MALPTVSEGGIVPTDLDILCGKTKQIINHPGTIRYQRVVESYTQRYINAESKFDKMTVTKSLHDYLRTTSRFLKYNDKAKTWEEITSLAARDKIGHALRFAVKASSDEKKKGRKKRGHRRVGSDFSAASLTSVATEASSNTVATATSDGGTMVKSLVQNLNTGLNLNNNNTTTKTELKAIPLKANSALKAARQQRHRRIASLPLMPSNNEPLYTLSEAQSPTSPQRASTGQQQPDLGTSTDIFASTDFSNLFGANGEGFDQLFASNNNNDFKSDHHPLFAPSNAESANNHQHPLVAPSEITRPVFTREASAGSSGNLSGSPSHHSSENNYHNNNTNFHDSSDALLASFSANPPMLEVVTTTVQRQPQQLHQHQQQQQDYDAGIMSQDFLSMLHEPIHEFDELEDLSE